MEEIRLCIFYNLNFYLDNLLDIFKIWQGGMSFHGGLIGLLLQQFYLQKNFKIFQLSDIVSFVSPIGIFLEE